MRSKTQIRRYWLQFFVPRKVTNTMLMRLASPSTIHTCTTNQTNPNPVTLTRTATKQEELYPDNMVIHNNAPHVAPPKSSSINIHTIPNIYLFQSRMPATLPRHECETSTGFLYLPSLILTQSANWGNVPLKLGPRVQLFRSRRCDSNAGLMSH